MKSIQIDPEGISITVDGEKIEAPGGKKFFIASREVTQVEFYEVLGQSPSKPRAPLLPVNRITRAEAAMFCKILTDRDHASGVLPKGKIYRLPTRSEWLIAALPGGKMPTPEALETLAWHAENSTGQPKLVGTKSANAYGLHDMFGNVAEWTDADLSTAADSKPRYAGRVTLQLSPEVSSLHEAASREAQAPADTEEDQR